MSLPPTPEFSGDLEQMNLSAGESVGQIKKIQSAAEIINEMMKGTEKIIKHRLLDMVTRVGNIIHLKYKAPKPNSSWFGPFTVF